MKEIEREGSSSFKLSNMEEGGMGIHEDSTFCGSPEVVQVIQKVHIYFTHFIISITNFK